MKKLLAFTILVLLSGCDTSNINTDFEIETPELPTGEETDSIEDVLEYPKIDMVFETTETPFAEIVELNPECFEEEYLEEHSDFIVIAEVNDLDETSVLTILEWLKGDPYQIEGPITFNNTISTEPSFDEGKTYQIYFNQVNGKFHTTCYQAGVEEIVLFD